MGGPPAIQCKCPDGRGGLLALRAWQRYGCPVEGHERAAVVAAVDGMLASRPDERATEAELDELRAELDAELCMCGHARGVHGSTCNAEDEQGDRCCYVCPGFRKAVEARPPKFAPRVRPRAPAAVVESADPSPQPSHPPRKWRRGYLAKALGAAMTARAQAPKLARLGLVALVARQLGSLSKRNLRLARHVVSKLEADGAA